MYFGLVGMQDFGLAGQTQYTYSVSKISNLFTIAMKKARKVHLKVAVLKLIYTNLLISMYNYMLSVYFTL